MKGSIYQQDITIVSTHILNIRVPKCVKQTLTYQKGEINNNTKIVGNFNTPISKMDGSSREQINKETLDLNYTLEQTDLRDVYTAFLPTAAKCTFFSSTQGTFSRIDQCWATKKSL